MSTLRTLYTLSSPHVASPDRQQHTCIFFTEVLWPDFSIWHLFSAVFSYQRNYDVIQVSPAPARASADFRGTAGDVTSPKVLNPSSETVETINSYNITSTNGELGAKLTFAVDVPLNPN